MGNCLCGDPGCARCFPTSYWRERAYEKAIEALEQFCTSEEQVALVIREGLRALAQAASEWADQRAEDRSYGIG